MGKRIIEQESVSEKDLDAALALVKTACQKAILTKKDFPFLSDKEAFGKLTEEYYETLKELHKKNGVKFNAEITDVAIVCIWYLAGLGKTKKIEDLK